jgi:CarD family transcriptional regulator
MKSSQAKGTQVKAKQAKSTAGKPAQAKAAAAKPTASKAAPAKPAKASARPAAAKATPPKAAAAKDKVATKTVAAAEAKPAEPKAAPKKPAVKAAELRGPAPATKAAEVGAKKPAASAKAPAAPAAAPEWSSAPASPATAAPMAYAAETARADTAQGTPPGPSVARPPAARPAAPGRLAPPRPQPAAAASSEPPLQFEVGDHVVYPTHGVGKVTGVVEEEIAGHRLTLIVIEFEENRMVLRVPVAKARSAGLRKLSSRKAIEAALATLKGRARVKRTMWSRRAQEYEAKINSGDPVAIAEVVRDLHRNAGQPDQSFSERQIYEQAMDRLAAELAAIDGVDKSTAQAKLATMLKAA